MQFLKIALMLIENDREKIKSVSFSKACPLPLGFFNTPVGENIFMASLCNTTRFKKIYGIILQHNWCTKCNKIEIT